MRTPQNSWSSATVEHAGTVDVIRWTGKHSRGCRRSVSRAAAGPRPPPRDRTVRPAGARVWPPTASRPAAATAGGRIDTRTICAAAAGPSRPRTAVRNRTAWCPRLLSPRSPGARNTGRTRRGRIGAGGRHPRPAATRTDASRSSLWTAAGPGQIKTASRYDFLRPGPGILKFTLPYRHRSSFVLLFSLTPHSPTRMLWRAKRTASLLFSVWKLVFSLQRHPVEVGPDHPCISFGWLTQSGWPT